MTSVLTLVFELFLVTNELQRQLTPKNLSKKEISKRKTIYRIIFGTVFAAIWLPFIPQMILFGSQERNKIRKHPFVMIITTEWSSLQVVIIYYIFVFMLVFSIRTIRNIASRFPDFFYSKQAIALLYSYSILCFVIPTFSLVVAFIDKEKVQVFLTEAFLE